MGVVISHLPIWFWSLIIGTAVATALILCHPKWPAWVKVPAFLFTVLMPFITVPVWVVVKLIRSKPH